MVPWRSLTDSENLYELWISDDYYFDIFCPDLENNEFTFYSEEGENDVRSVIFNIDKCKPENNPPGFCKSDQEITDYLKDLQVQLIILE